MCLKLVIVFATISAISCASFDSREQDEHFSHREIDQRRVNQQERFDNQRHYLEKFDNRYIKEQNFNGRRFSEHHENPTFLHLQPAVFNVQSSSRLFNVHDDSNYDVAYSVSDMTTGDIKTHQETRRGDEVHGQYTLVDSDGFQRKVNYHANDRDGFDVEVKREPVFGIEFTNNYQGLQNQHNFYNHFNQQLNNQNFESEIHNNQQLYKDQLHHNKQAQHLTFPKSVATTSVSKTDDGQLNQYTTTTSTN